MDFWMIPAALVLLGGGSAVGYLYRKKIVDQKLDKTDAAITKLIEEAKKKAEEISKTSILQAKEEALTMRAEVDKEIRDRRTEIQRVERRLMQREETLDKKMDSLEGKEQLIAGKQSEILEMEKEAVEVIRRQQEELERICNMTGEEAKAQLVQSIEQEAKHDAALRLREIDQRLREEADRKARNIISGAIQRCAADHVAEATVSVVPLPNDDMKGRIIGREGRNIRTLETATGVDLIIDDTPEAVILSGFDPIRREVARIALERLVSDGRIHPARIEEMVEKAQREVEAGIRESGDSAVLETGIHGLHHELTRLLGRMKFRTSYGQNVLKHSIEVSLLAALMASEIGADVMLAKRAGLLHDIGKSIDHEVEGTHVSIGVELLTKYRESKEVIHCVAAHHNDIEPTTVEAVLVQAADAISGARPGARRETVELYIKRLQKLEEICNSFEGVERSYAIQAGREVRIVVKPEEIDDPGMMLLAREIVKRIEGEMEYPGQIKVNVMRETRAVDFAK